MLRLIVGLGNPTNAYAETRHNAGFWFADALAAAYSASFSPNARFESLLARLEAAGQELILLKPQTYMNHSGRAVAAVCRYFRFAPSEVLVAHDELDFQPGVIKLKQGGGHGGHNGLRDIVVQLQSADFHRLRIGIGHPGVKELVSPYVLARPAPADRAAMNAAIARAVDLAELLFAGRMQEVSNRLNVQPRPNLLDKDSKRPR